MQLVSSIMSKRINVLAVICVCVVSQASAQNINSPYSRYGLGDILSNQNILNRGMGGVATAYADFQSVNFLNPASYGQLQSVTYDIGLEVNSLAIRSLNPVRKFSNASPNISYVNLGIPLKKKGGWGLVFGLRPMTRINYKVLRNERLITGTINDSISTVFEGSGGAQQVFAGTGFRIGKFTAGINAGYLFGSKDYSTRRAFNNDTVAYYKSNHQSKTNYSGFVFNAGVQYYFNLNKKTVLRLGAQGSWEQQVKGTRDLIRETYSFDANDANYTIDSVYAEKGTKGTVNLPGSYSAGFIIDRLGRWQIGVDYLTTQWSKYTFFGEKDNVQDSWELRLGGQLIPAAGKSYWSNVAYRGGFSYGKDYISVDGDLKKWAISFGAALPMRRVAYTNQFSIINTAIEFGQRGSKTNLVKENFFKISVGLAMSDIWFIKRQYN